MMGKKKKIPPNYLDTVFVPAKELHWKQRKDGIIVLDMVNKGFFHSIAQKFFHRPGISHIALDEYGTRLWLCLDGQRTVFQVVEAMEQAFPDETERMLDRVVTFLRTLQMNHFICDKSEDL